MLRNLLDVVGTIIMMVFVFVYVYVFIYTRAGDGNEGDSNPIAFGLFLSEQIVTGDHLLNLAAVLALDNVLPADLLEGYTSPALHYSFYQMLILFRSKGMVIIAESAISNME